ncbi:hypothetical protein [Dactylosporangium sp. CA-139066]|uniref:hypothetical protein n=1 Tax=Dactylosporangium sp. CA-139066 TaxID=3239930 RepID=UPI003D8C0ABF
MEVRWFDPLIHDVATKGRAGVVTHVLDGRPVPYVARPYKTILLTGPRRPDVIQNITELAQTFDLSISAMKSTLSLIPTESSLIKDVRFTNTQVHWTVETHGRAVQFSGRGGPGLGLESLILLELAGFHARHHARIEPTFLLLDEFLDFYTPQVQVAALERLQEAAEHAQVAIVSHSPFIVAEVSSDWAITALEQQPLNRWDSPFDFEVETKPLPGTER